MKKVIKPSKQPTKKRSLRTAKLTIAISKIAAQLVKDHPKLIKGGGSLGITELLFSKILIKGGKLNDAARKKIIEFLNDIAPQVNKLKQELITKLLEYLATKDIVVKDDNICVNIYNIINEFMKGLYDYDIKDEDQKNLGNLKEEIKEYFAILDIVKKYYILSRLKDDKTDASIMNQINKNKFEQLPPDILKALKEKNENLKTILEEYLEKKKRDNGNGAPKVEEDDDTLQILRTTLEQLQRDVARYISLFFFTNKIIIGREEKSFIFKTPPVSDVKDKEEALKNLNDLYKEFNDKINNKFNEISSKYDKKDTKYNLVDIEEDLKILLELNETLNQIYSKKEDINKYLDIIDPTRQKNRENIRQETMEVIPDLSPDLSPDLQALDAGWNKKQGKPLAIPSTGGNPAKYKSTGQVVYIMYQNKKYKRVIYVKDKRNTRYCKINKEYILLSKLKVIQ